MNDITSVRNTAGEHGGHVRSSSKCRRIPPNLEQLVDQILAQSATPPIIIVHADEGPELRYDIDRSSDAAARICKRCGVTTAYHFPDRDAADLVPQGMSPVNMFRWIFREYFSADVTLLPDRYFYWDPPDYYGKPELTRPCRFVDVTDLLLESGDLAQ